MMQSFRRNLSFANVTSMIALTIALGGTSYAAVALPKNSVTSKQIKAKSVKNSDLGTSSITTDKVKDFSLLKTDFAANQLPSGPQGATGQRGATGATGAFGAATVQYEVAAADLADNTKGSYDAYCPAGQQAISGGGRGDATTSEETSVTSSRPALSTTNAEPPVDGQGFTGWRITATNLNGGVIAGIRPEVWVVCVPAPVPAA